MAISSRFRHSVTIERQTSGAPDARGNPAATWTADDAPIRGNVQRRTSRDVRGAQPADVASSDAIGFLPITTAVSPHDRLVVGGSVYEIIGPPRDAGGRGRQLEVDLLVVVP